MIDQADLDCAQRTVPNDVCFVVSALTGHVIRTLEENSEEKRSRKLPAENTAETFGLSEASKGSGFPERIEKQSPKDYPSARFEISTGKPIELPAVCEQCLLDALPAIVRHATGTAPNLRWIKPWPESSPENTISNTPNASCETFVPLSQDIATSISHGRSGAHESRPRIGIVGNALLCFDAFMNDDIVSFIESQGCEVVMPDPALLYTDDVRYLPQLDRFAAQGVQHVIYLQSFGCLKGHIRARGALHELARRHPAMPVTVIDYDPEASALNRENRIRLALAATKAAIC